MTLWNKVEFYSKHDEIVRSVEALTGKQPTFSSITINWRGCFSPQSALDLKTVGFTEADLGLLSAITVEQGAIIHRLFKCSTYTTFDFPPSHQP